LSGHGESSTEVFLPYPPETQGGRIVKVNLYLAIVYEIREGAIPWRIDVLFNVGRIDSDFKPLAEPKEDKFVVHTVLQSTMSI